MRLNKIAAIAEIVSSVAIVLTLIYLTIQTQQTNKALFASSREVTMLADVKWRLATANDPDLAAPFNPDPDKREYQKLLNYSAAYIRIREFAWIQHEAGILDDQTWESYLSVLLNDIQTDSTFRRIWSDLSAFLTPGFVREVNAAATNGNTG